MPCKNGRRNEPTLLSRVVASEDAVFKSLATMNQFPTLQRLASLAQEMRAHPVGHYRRGQLGSALGEVGLVLLDPSSNAYAKGSATIVSFATTGSDGVHFGFLEKESPAGESSPVVLCVPGAERLQVIAEDLQESLALGCEHGWRELEDLAYKREETIRAYSRRQNNETITWPQKDHVLHRINEALGLTWRPLDTRRLAMLSDTYSSCLE